MAGERTNYMAISFSIAAAWFASHCGGGFATGNQELNFYSKYGYTAFFLPFISMIIVAWVMRNALIIAKDNKSYEYKSFANALYHPYEKIFSIVFEITIGLLILTAVSTAIAGAGALLNSALAVPYGLAIVGVGAVLLLLTIFGSELVLRALNYKTYFMIVTLLIACFLGVRAGLGRSVEVLANQDAFGQDFWVAVWNMFLYAGFQSCLIAPVISMSQKITTNRQCNHFLFYGIGLNGVFLTIVCIMIVGFTPGILGQTLPVYYITQQLGFSWLKVLYSVILFVALLGTGVSLTFASVARFENVWKGVGVFESLRARRIAICIITMAICVGISTFGLTALVVKGYGFIGYIGLAFVVVPLLTIGTVKIRRAAALRRDQGIRETMAEADTAE
jgi:uncharacterized membrane protein YkvI